MADPWYKLCPHCGTRNHIFRKLCKGCGKMIFGAK